MFSQWKSYQKVSTECSQSMDEKEERSQQNRTRFQCDTRSILLCALLSICGAAILLALGIYQAKSLRLEHYSHDHGSFQET